jgi:hypothetical protein
LNHEISAMTRVTVGCTCGRLMRLPVEWNGISKALCDDKLLDMHAAHAAAMKEQGR